MRVRDLCLSILGLTALSGFVSMVPASVFSADAPEPEQIISHRASSFDFTTPYVVPTDLYEDIAPSTPPGETLEPPAPPLVLSYPFEPWAPPDIAPIPGIPGLPSTRRDHPQFDLLIIAHEDFVSALGPLRDHKNATGIATRIYSWQYLVDYYQTYGQDDPERIKTAIVSFRQYSGISYVMLVGDSDRLPVRYCMIYDPTHWGHGYSPADLYYADLYEEGGTRFDDWDGDGDGVFCEMAGGTWTAGSTLADINLDGMDLYPDIALGRVPASTVAEVTTYVDKVMSYEFTATKSPWFDEALLVVPGYRDSVTGRYHDYPGSVSAKEDIASDLSAAGVSSTKLYDSRIHGLPAGLSDGDPTAASITAQINDGVGFVNFSGHGSRTSWSGAINSTDVRNLTNESKLPVVFAAACNTAQFNFVKTWLDVQGNVFTQVCPDDKCWPVNPGSQVRPEPAPVQRTNGTSYDVDSMAEEFLVKSASGGIAYIGSYTGTQGGSQILDRYFFEAYRYSIKPPRLGYLWHYAVREYIDNDFHINFNDSSDWYPMALFHHIQKYMLYGDPSLRVGGIQDAPSICGPSWQYLGAHPQNTATASNLELVRVHADGELCRYHHGGPPQPIVLIRRNGHILRYEGTSWELIDDNPNSVAVAATRNFVFQRHRNGRVWRWDGGFRFWTEIDDYLDTGKRLAAAAHQLCQIRSNGHIYRYSTIEPYPTWVLLDENPSSDRIEAGDAGLFQMHRGTNWIWKYAGNPKVWDLVDLNVASEDITVGNDTAFQIHHNGNIYRWNNPTALNWTQIDDNPLSVRIVARGDKLFQRHSNGNVWRWLGGFRIWENLGGIDNDAVEIFGSVGTIEADADGDGIPDSGDNCSTVRNADQSDSDRDGIGDVCDNCRHIPNAEAIPSGHAGTGGQVDDDRDGLGNRCDCDFTEDSGDEFVNVSDLLLFLEAFGKPVDGSDCPDSSGEPLGSCCRYDLNVLDAFINVSDLLMMISPEMFGHPTSGQGCAEDDTGVVQCPLP